MAANSIAENPFLNGNFAPMDGETTAFDLKVRGRIPDELEGRCLRIGPNPIGPIDPANFHWFMGAGLVHGLRLRGGRAEWYRSRFVMSADVAEALGKAPLSGPGEHQGVVNTHVADIGGRVYALIEAGISLPIELDYNLESVARSDFNGKLESNSYTAHPKLDPKTGERVAITYTTGRPTLRYVVVDRAGRAETRAEIAAPHQPMVHDTAFTQNFVIVLDLPVIFQPQLAPGHSYPYFWNDQQPPRIGLLPRNGDVSGMTWFDAPASSYVFHIANAYETEAGEVIVDVVRHGCTFRFGHQGPEGSAMLVRWTLDRVQGRVTERPLDDRGCEFPRFNDRFGGQDYRYAYTVQCGPTLGPAYKHDVRHGRTEVHNFGAGHASMEGVFVPRDGGVDEDDGYLLYYVFNPERNACDFVILSAQDFAGPPLAVVELPVRVPFGFHGDWFPDQR